MIPSNKRFEESLTQIDKYPQGCAEADTSLALQEWPCRSAVLRCPWLVSQFKPIPKHGEPDKNVRMDMGLAEPLVRKAGGWTGRGGRGGFQDDEAG